MFTLIAESQPFWPNCWLCQRGAYVVQLPASHRAGTAGHLPTLSPWEPKEITYPGVRHNSSTRDLTFITLTPSPLSINKGIKITNAIKMEKSSHLRHQSSTSEETGLIVYASACRWQTSSSYSQEEQLLRKCIMYSSPSRRKCKVSWCFPL